VVASEVSAVMASLISSVTSVAISGVAAVYVMVFSTQRVLLIAPVCLLEPLIQLAVALGLWLFFNETFCFL